MIPPQEIIIRLRDGAPLARADIDEFVRGVTAGAAGEEGAWSEGQVSAFAMAVFFRGMEPGLVADLTRAMVRSGERLDWSDAGLSGPVLDKHSSGGVGDKVSLPLAAVVAACGGCVPMISGRGLGHTGGTLDKLDSVPGYVTQPDIGRFRSVVQEAGCAIIGQTADLAPADRRLYAIRDITGTVESTPLITASILSKKLAAGLDGLAMDIKVGNGAFCRTMDMAEELALSIVRVAHEAGLPTTALITDMNRVLGRTAGNAVEVRESIEMLMGRSGETRLLTLVYDLAAEMLVLGGLAADQVVARQQAEAALVSGRAAERFGRMVTALGGPADLMDRVDDYLPQAPVQRALMPQRSGYVASMDTRAVGVAIVRMGGGRMRALDTVDHAPGLTEIATVGEAIGKGVGGGRPLAVVHARDEAGFEVAREALWSAVEVVDDPPASLEASPVMRRITVADALA